MLGVLVNTFTVLLGGALGMLLNRSLPERITSAVMVAIGLCTVYIGIDGALEGNNTIVLILSLVLGTIVGTALDIEGKLAKAGELVAGLTKHQSGTVVQGFVTGSLLFCVGAMTIVGSINAGLRGDNKLLLTKSILDFISSCMLASTLGLGVLLSAAFVLVFQGLLVLGAGFLQNVLSDAAVIAEITCSGSVMIIGLGLNLLGLGKFKVADMLPAILFVPLVYWLLGYLPL